MYTPDDDVTPDYGQLLETLQDRCFVVLGCGQGIGRQAAHALSQLGAQTCCVDRLPDLADQVANEVGGFPWHADMTSREEAAGVFEAAYAKWGRLDGVVDVIGRISWAPLADVEDAVWDGEFATNLRHAFIGMQLGARHMTSGGAMVFVSSVSSLSSSPGHAPYGAAKAALSALVKSAAVEWAGRGIRVNAVAPGLTATPRVASRLSDDDRAAHEHQIPAGRLGRPADIAATIAFLASDMSSYITGQTLVVDGGATIAYPYERL